MRRHPKHARTNPNRPAAWATSDRSGFIGNQKDMQWQHQWSGTQLINLNILVYPWEYDEPQRQLGTIILPPDPVAIRNARPEQYYVDEYAAILPEVPTPWTLVPGRADGGGFAGRQPGRIGRQPATKGFYLENLSGEIAQELGGYYSTAYTGEGIVPGPNSGGGGGGGGSGAVHFDGTTTLVLSLISSVDSPKFTAAFWAKTNWDFVGQRNVVYVVDPKGNYDNYFTDDSGFPGGASVARNNNTLVYNVLSGYSDTTWQHWTISCETDFSSGNKLIAIYVNRQNLTHIVSDNNPSFNMAFHGLPLWIGSDEGDGFNGFIGDMADVGVWPGVSIVQPDGSITSANLDLFITSGGNRVSPTLSIASLGTPSIMLTGNATQFPLNTLGSDGALTVTTGMLTNAATQPPGS